MRPLARIWCSILCSRRRTGPANTPTQLSTGDKLHVDINVNRNEGTPPDPASSDSTGPSFFVARKYEFEAHVNPFCALLHPHSVSCNEALSRASRMAGKSPQGRCHIHTSDITTRRCFRCCLGYSYTKRAPYMIPPTEMHSAFWPAEQPRSSHKPSAQHDATDNPRWIALWFHNRLTKASQSRN
jgi:hypothetical protein